MFVFKTKAQITTPNAEEISDEKVRSFADQIIKILKDEFRSVVDDLKKVERIERVDTLPTTLGSENVGKMYILNGTGVASDSVYLCVDTGSSGYAFKEVFLL
jgi:hypothetical protein